MTCCRKSPRRRAPAAARPSSAPATSADPADIQRLLQAALQPISRIDVWINNVGIGALGPFWDIPIEAHARVIDVNLKDLVYGAHAAVRHFRQQGFGTLVNIGSIDSEVPLAYQACYKASYGPHTSAHRLPGAVE